MEKEVKDRFENLEKKVDNIDTKFDRLLETLIKTNRTSLCELRKAEIEKLEQRMSDVESISLRNENDIKILKIKNRKKCLRLGRNRIKN